MLHPLTLPLEDPAPDDASGITALSEPGRVSLSRQILEDVMAAEFPDVACLPLEAYAHRISHIVYTTGFQVFYLDRLPDLPGYTVVAMEPPTMVVSETGEMVASIRYQTGPAAAARAEAVQRLIPPDTSQR